MIDYEKINSDQNYYNEVLEQIRSTSDMLVLNNLLKMLSIKIHQKEVDAVHAEELCETIKSRIRVLTGKDKHHSTYDDRGYEKGKSMVMHPVSNSVMSDHRGMTSMVFIVLSVAVTSVMYTLLLITKFIK